ncbi:MAG: T9SS type A sorting domain-containing protein, partial [Cyanobacteria bacterium P01_D01_bin.128]
LGDYDWLEFNSSYSVRVRVAEPSNAGLINHSGEAVTVHTPPKTRLRNSYKDKVLPSDNLLVEAYPIPGASLYKFYVSGVDNPIESTEPSISLGDYDWLEFNSSYSVRVRVAEPSNAGLINHSGGAVTIFTTEGNSARAYSQSLPNRNGLIKIYPNPSSGRFVLNTEYKECLEIVNVMDIRGKDIPWSETTVTNGTEVEVNTLGIIFLTFMYHDELYSERIYVNPKTKALNKR